MEYYCRGFIIKQDFYEFQILSTFGSQTHSNLLSSKGKAMSKLLRVFTFSILIALVVGACGASTESTEVAPLVIQSTPTAAKLDLVAQADTSVQYTTVGQVIKIGIAVKNNGEVGVAGAVVVTGALATCPALTTVGNLNDSLDPTESVNCTADYTITQADLDKGSVSIVLSATINGIVSNQSTVNVNVGQPKVLTLTVSANPTSYSQADQEITISYLIKYDGSGSLGPTQFAINDKLIGANPFSCGNPDVTLASGQTVSCTAKYKTTQADMGLVSIVSSASASGAGINSAQPISTTINKGSATNPANLTAGSTIQHKVIKGEWLWQIARCYGADPNKIIQANPQIPDPSKISPDMVLSVPNIGSNGKIYGAPCVVSHTVAAGDTWNSIAQLYNADPAILQMVKSNSLTVGSIVIVPKNSAGSSSTPPSSDTKSLSLTTTANPATYEQVGQQITLTYTIKNTGNTNLGPAQFTVTDTLIGATPLNCGANTTSLTPGTTVTCTVVYSITQADLNLASITNRATASGGGAGPSAEGNTTINKVVKALTLTVTSSTPTYNQAGQTITLTYTIKNAGTVNLGPAQFTVTDALIGATPINCGNADASIPANTTITCTANYTVTQADLNLASIASRATASGGGASTSPEASVTITKQ